MEFKAYNHIPHSYEPDESIIKPDIRLIIAYDVLYIFGLVFLSAILCTAWFSSSIRRSTAWYSFHCAWVFSCIGYLLILGYQTGPSPGHIHCLFQAMLIHAFPALNTLTFVTFMLEIWLTISGLSTIFRTTMIIFYLVPYGVFTGILIEVLILGILNPTAVLRKPDGYFCHMSILLPVRITSTIAICAVIAGLILGVRIILKCRKHWEACKPLLIRNNTPFGLTLRLGLVGLCLILTIGLAIADEVANWDNAFSLSLAVLPPAIGIIFGSQGDMLRLWMFWRKRKPLPTLATATV
ncbi:hypothetical protein BYT27DRAFT_7251391 [Phlegmacium glaucopus]|nr:hypothetical protein BYT27DRAFT_7252559 [Phlegmacium glaucopus]KAF8812971.1 hypothetical protein BYT27DRAFT_7251391 [Phlegmacium glaucopus]